MTSTLIKLSFLILPVLLSCRKQFDHPPLDEPGETQQISVTDLRGRVPENSGVYRFTGDTGLYCTVIADESSGNFYSAVFVRDDEQKAILVNLKERGGIYTGDRIRIHLDGVYVKNANGCFALDSVSASENIVKISSGNKVTPKASTIRQVLEGLNGGPDLQSDLVELNEVEFIHAHRMQQFADPVSRIRKDLTLTGCSGNTIALSTSGFADFAGKLTPDLNGKIAAIVVRQGEFLHLELRRHGDINMTAPACTGSASPTGTFVLPAAIQTVDEHFNEVNDQSDFIQEGWINCNQLGTVRWKGNLKAGNYRALKMTCYGSAEKTVSWLIAPPLTYSPGKRISFRTGVEYFKSGHLEPLMAFVSTDFDGKNLATANWTALTQAVYAGMSDGNYNGPGGLKSSGEIPLSNIPLLAKGSGTFCLAFKYTGEPGFDTNVYVDDVVVK